ncbi:MAG: lipid-A-disaccharide synthase [Pseudomonadota bacterium]
MASVTSRQLYFVVGEPSGDVLGAAVLSALNADERGLVQPLGLGGRQLQAAGLQSLFEIDRLSVMGFGPVIARLPDLLKRVKTVVADILAKRPDAVLLIDSPEFCALVAKRVRKRAPDIPIIKYVCPSVWAWRPGRAAKMASYIDHVLCLLPFEPEALARLGGPPGTYVGHPLSTSMAEWRAQTTNSLEDEKPIELLLLPGSRRSEIERSLPAFLSVAEQVSESRAVHLTLPTLEKREQLVRDLLAQSRLPVDVVVGEEARLNAMRHAHAALATSGTISLELALARVPHAIFYRTAGLDRLATPFITSWSVNLPNLILDEPVVPECVGDHAKLDRLMRELKALLADNHARRSQADAFSRLWERVETAKPPAELAADALRQAANL